MRALAGDAVGKIVSQKKERYQESKPRQRPKPRPTLAHSTLSASVTVKRPSESMRCSSLRNPAPRTSSSSSSCVRPPIPPPPPPPSLAPAPPINPLFCCHRLPPPPP